jgi:ApaG protein
MRRRALSGAPRSPRFSAVSGSEAITNGIRIRVVSQYLPDHASSEPRDRQWFFTYTVRISNEGFDTVQLVSRHWQITDANGHTEEVRGPGVVGAQPVLAPGESFEYTSGCPLRTAFGTMKGAYQMVSDDGQEFDAEIAPFALNVPYAVN